ncbi:MAG: prepilin-type N-terminal cleavage/methylation domain-containing protein [Verrucomicrobia bacterium]|nr:prepilin-type N-terminal cleavage/methylation domain-containing protein [Verrucomicrobiota bacterium]
MKNWKSIVGKQVATTTAGAANARRPTLNALRSASGFTLVELMAVIVIIGIVSGIVIAGAGFANRTAMKNRTVTTVHQVNTAAEMFFADRGGFPPDVTCTTSTTDANNDDLRSNQFVWPSEALWFYLAYKGVHLRTGYQKQPYMVFKREQLITGNTKIQATYDEAPGNYMQIVDAWGNPLNYKSYDGNSYKFTDGTMMPRHNNKTTGTIWGSPSCDICSYGADGTTWQDRDKPYDRQRDLKLDQMTTVEHWNGIDHPQIPVYFTKPFETQVTAGGGIKHCYGGEDNDDINNWQQR